MSLEFAVIPLWISSRLFIAFRFSVALWGGFSDVFWLLGVTSAYCNTAAMLLWQVSDRACDEGVRVMDKGVEKAGAVFDKGALFFGIPWYS